MCYLKLLLIAHRCRRAQAIAAPPCCGCFFLQMMKVRFLSPCLCFCRAACFDFIQTAWLLNHSNSLPHQQGPWFQNSKKLNRDGSFNPQLVYVQGPCLFNILTLNTREKLSSVLIAGGTPLRAGTRGHRNATFVWMWNSQRRKATDSDPRTAVEKLLLLLTD